MSVDSNLDQSDQEFLTKKQIFCQNRCKFKLEPVETEVHNIGDSVQVQKVIKTLMYCEYCGLIDDVTVNLSSSDNENESKAS